MSRTAGVWDALTERQELPDIGDDDDLAADILTAVDPSVFETWVEDTEAFRKSRPSRVYRQVRRLPKKHPVYKATKTVQKAVDARRAQIGKTVTTKPDPDDKKKTMKLIAVIVGILVIVGVIAYGVFRWTSKRKGRK
jgi:hypothetical protein